MTLKALLAVLLSLQNTDLTSDRATVVSSTLYKAADGDVRVLSLLTAIGYYESRYLDRIQAGRCRWYECDSFVWKGERRFRSRSYFQLQRGACESKAEWQSTTGLATENIEAAAMIAGKRVRRALKACGTYEGAASWYAYGACSTWLGAGKRAELARRIEARLRS